MRTQLVSTVILTYFDIGSDISVILEQSAANTVWTSLLVLFLVLHPTLTCCYYLYLVHKGVLDCKTGMLKAFTALFMLDPLLATYKALKRGNFTNAMMRKTDYKNGLMTSLPLHYLKLAEALFENLPSLMLQLYIALVSHTPTSGALSFSLAIGWLSLTSSVFMFRLGDDEYGRIGFLIRRKPILALVSLALFCLSETVIRVGSVAIFAAAYKSYIAVYFLGLLFTFFLLVRALRRFTDPAFLRRSGLDSLFSFLNLVILFQPEIKEGGAKASKAAGGGIVGGAAVSPVAGDAGVEEEKSREKSSHVVEVAEVAVKYRMSRDDTQAGELGRRRTERKQRLGLFCLYSVAALSMALLAFYPPDALLRSWPARGSQGVPGNITLGVGWYNNMSKCEVLPSSRQRCPFPQWVLLGYLTLFSVMVVTFVALESFFMRPSTARSDLSNDLVNLEALKEALRKRPGLCEAKNELGMLPLHELATMEVCPMDCVAEVLKHNPDAVKELTDTGDTVLHLCLKSGNHGLAEGLLCHSLLQLDEGVQTKVGNGLKVAQRVEDRTGSLPLLLAAKHQAPENVMDALREANPKFMDQKNKAGASASAHYRLNTAAGEKEVYPRTLLLVTVIYCHGAASTRIQCFFPL